MVYALGDGCIYSELFFSNRAFFTQLRCAIAVDTLLSFSCRVYVLTTVWVLCADASVAFDGMAGMGSKSGIS